MEIFLEQRFQQLVRELRGLGYSDFDVVRKLGVKPQSLMRQLSRYGIKASPELIDLVQEQKRSS